MQTTYHRDGTVTIWDVYRQQWVRTDPRALRDEVIAALGATDSKRIAARIARLQNAD